jgi:hypothetical protein
MTPKRGRVGDPDVYFGWCTINSYKMYKVVCLKDINTQVWFVTCNRQVDLEGRDFTDNSGGECCSSRANVGRWWSRKSPCCHLKVRLKVLRVHCIYPLGLARVKGSLFLLKLLYTATSSDHWTQRQFRPVTDTSNLPVESSGHGSAPVNLVKLCTNTKGGCEC